MLNELEEEESDEEDISISPLERKDSSNPKMRKVFLFNWFKSIYQNNPAAKAKLNVAKKVFEPIVEESVKAEEPKAKVINTEEYKKQLLNSEELLSFVNKNSRFIERAISERTCLDLFESHLLDDIKIDKNEKTYINFNQEIKRI